MIDAIDISWLELCSDEGQRTRSTELRPRLIQWGLEPAEFDANAYEAMFDEMIALSPNTEES